MYSQYLNACIIIFAGVSQLSTALYIPESFSAASVPPLAPRQEGFPGCFKHPEGTCSITYIIDPTQGDTPIEIQLLSPDCESGIGGATQLTKDTFPPDVQTTPLITSPITSLTVKYVAEDEPAEVKMDGIDGMHWTRADKKGKKIWAAPFPCNMRHA